MYKNNLLENKVFIILILTEFTQLYFWPKGTELNLTCVPVYP